MTNVILFSSEKYCPKLGWSQVMLIIYELFGLSYFIRSKANTVLSGIE